MADQPIHQSFPHEHPGSVSFRLILPTGVDPGAVERVREKIGKSLEISYAKDIGAAVVMNEKTAAVFFPDTSGNGSDTRVCLGSIGISQLVCGSVQPVLEQFR